MDYRGAVKSLTPALARSAAGLVREGKIYPLGQVLDTNIPQLDFFPPFVKVMQSYPDRTRKQFKARGLAFEPGPASERLEFCPHLGTHIDALGHWSNFGLAYGGVDAADNCTPRGLETLGIDECGPIVTRGVLVDVPAARGVDRLEGGTVMTVEDFEHSLRRQGVTLTAGDVALVRSGWGQLWNSGDGGYLHTQPGVDPQAARWLAAQGVVAVGGDTNSLEVAPSLPCSEFGAVHQALLVDSGVYIIENMNLEELSRDRAYEFMFICLPVPLRGGTGFPVNPVAIR